MLLQADPGTEIYIPFARKKLALWKEQLGKLGLRSFARRIDVSDGSAIYVNSVKLGNGRYNDRIRITGGGLFGRAMISCDDSQYNGATTYYAHFGTGVGLRVKTVPIGSSHSGFEGTSAVFPVTLTPNTIYTRIGWSKDYSTLVTVNVNTHQAEIIRGEYHQVLSDVATFDNKTINVRAQQEVLNAYPKGIFSTANSNSRGFLYGQYHVGISSDGAVVLLRHREPHQIVRCVWNVGSGIYDVTIIDASLGEPAAQGWDAGLGYYHRLVAPLTIPLIRMWLNPYTGTDVVVEASGVVGAGTYADIAPSASGAARMMQYDAVTGVFTEFHYAAARPFAEISYVLFEPTSKEPHRFSYTPYYWGTSVNMVPVPGYGPLQHTSFTIYRDGAAWITDVSGGWDLPDGDGLIVGQSEGRFISNEVIFIGVGDGGRGVIRSTGRSGVGRRGIIWRGLDDEPEVYIYCDQSPYGGAETISENFRFAAVSKSGRFFYHNGYGGSTVEPLHIYHDGVLVFTAGSANDSYILYRTSYTVDNNFEAYSLTAPIGIYVRKVVDADGVWSVVGSRIFSGLPTNFSADASFSYPNPAYAPDAATPEAIAAYLAAAAAANEWTIGEELADWGLTYEEYAVLVATPALTGPATLSVGANAAEILPDEFVP